MISRSILNSFSFNTNYWSLFLYKLHLIGLFTVLILDVVRNLPYILPFLLYNIKKEFISNIALGIYYFLVKVWLFQKRQKAPVFVHLIRNPVYFSPPGFKIVQELYIRQKYIQCLLFLLYAILKYFSMRERSDTIRRNLYKKLFIKILILNHAYA